MTFKSAAKAFSDDKAEIYYDDFNSQSEERFVLIGMDESERVLTVCHCYRGKKESVTRIISARKASSSEKKLYGGAE